MLNRKDDREYLKYSSFGISGSPTRGIVMATNDPLYSGRVKVWIPTLHGSLATTFIGGENGNSFDPLIPSTLVLSPGASNDQKNTDALPWADVLSSNWGSVGNPVTGEIIADFGLYNVPKIGTEVWIIFENNNIDRPIVIGSVNHQAKFLTTEANTPLEIGSGILTFAQLSDADKQSAYPEDVGQFYSVQGQKGSYLILSEIISQEQVRLGSSISYNTEISVLSTLNGTQYTKFKQEYPNFPSTSTAGFRFTNLPLETSSLLTTAVNTNPSPTSSSNSSTNTASQTSTTPTSSSNLKALPVKASFPNPTGAQTFMSPRSYGGHVGIDLAVPVGTTLYAPEDCVPLSAYNSSGAGLMLLVKGASGYCHAFLHLSQINPIILNDLGATPPRYKTYKLGDMLGTTGNAGTDSHGPHLHWETFKEVGTVQTAADINALRTAGARGGQYKGINIAKESIFIDPIVNWLKNGQIVVGPNQVAQLYTAFSQQQTDQERVIGLEMSLVSGGETVFLRHPSGAFLGFDPDGNFKLYTPGDAYFKVNRSIIYDVLGGILTSCLAAYNKIKSVYKTYAGVLLPTVSTYNQADFPAVFQRIDSSRYNDMQDALSSLSSNYYYSLSKDTESKTLDELSNSDYGAYANSTSFSMSQFTLPFTKYDSFIKSSYTNYIQNSKNSAIKLLVSKGVLSIDLLKAIILVESNGDPSKINQGTGAIGLMQLTKPAVNQIKKFSPTNSDMLEYLDPQKNIDLGTQYFMYCVSLVLTKTQTAYISMSRDFDLTADQAKDIVKISLLTYTAGQGNALKNYSTLLLRDTVPSYLSVEQDYYTRINNQEGLNYAPKVYFVYNNITKTV